MSGSDSNRIPPNRVALSLVLLLVVWLVFSFYPRNKTPPPAAPPPVVESKLRAVGLEDNPDWDGLPEFFAVWADHAEWKKEKTQFAYWNPGSQSYSYYFEAVRDSGKIRFRVISKTEAIEWKEVFDDSIGVYIRTDVRRSPDEIQEVDFRTESQTHPFVFFQSFEKPKGPGARPALMYRESYPDKLPPGAKPPPISLPEFKITPPQDSDDPKKK